MKMVKLFKQFTLTVMVVLLAAACQSPKQKAIDNIQQMENELFGEDGTLDRTRVDDLINVYINYADTYPDDTLAPAYLFKAGDIAMNTNRANQAITCYSSIIDKYPEYPKLPEALFLEAYVYENNLGRLDKARSLYEEFLSKYPDNEFADDARVSLKYLGKTPEELIEIFSDENAEKKAEN